MNEIELLENSLTKLENNMTLKSNYDNELEILEAIENNARIEHHFGANTNRIKAILEKVRYIKQWITEELSNK